MFGRGCRFGEHTIKGRMCLRSLCDRGHRRRGCACGWGRWDPRGVCLGIGNGWRVGLATSVAVCNEAFEKFALFVNARC